MNRIKAFLTAFLLFILSVCLGHAAVHVEENRNNPAFSLWPSEEKAKNREAICRNWNEGSIPVFGSSEFQHGLDTPFHPSAVFSGNRFNPMLIGAGYYQSLSHAITLSAIEEDLSVRKAVLIISPQWFRKPGVVDQAFASRFSETMYYAMAENEKISEENRSYMIERSGKLLGGADPKTAERVKKHIDPAISGRGLFPDAISDAVWTDFLKEKDAFMIRAAEIRNGIKRGSGIPDTEEEPDWEALLAAAEEAGEASYQNDFYISQDAYDRLEPYLPEKKGMNSDALKGYQNSPEYDDLRCFLRTCRELDIEPMLVLMPVNGYYYDFTEFPASARQAYYEKVRAVAEEFQAVTADFTDQEYTKYFFEDRVHLGAKGWVMVNEKIYRFYRGWEV